MPVDRDGDRQLERRVGHALSRLARPRAPRTLLPRVMAAVSRPWYARAWLTWPALAQAGSVAALLAVVGGALWGAMAADELWSFSALARVGWRWLVAPLAMHFFVTAVALSVVAAASWEALTRVALGGLPE